MGKLLAAGALSQPSTEQSDDRTTDANANDDKSLTQDTVHHLLSNRRRRNILRYLADVDGATTLSNLAAQIAAWEHDVPLTEVTSEQRKRVHISLFQAHLPKLDAEGIIDHDQDRGRVELAEEADELVGYLEDDEQEILKWNRFYLALAVLSLGVVGLACLGTCHRLRRYLK